MKEKAMHSARTKEKARVNSGNLDIRDSRLKSPRNAEYVVRLNKHKSAYHSKITAAETKRLISNADRTTRRTNYKKLSQTVNYRRHNFAVSKKLRSTRKQQLVKKRLQNL